MLPTLDAVAPLQALGPAPAVAASHPADIQVADMASRSAAPASAQDAAAFSRAVQASERPSGVTASIEAQAALPPSADSLGSRLARQADALSHAAAIARILDGDAVRSLVALIGEDMRDVALRGRGLSGPTTASTPQAIATAMAAHDAPAPRRRSCARRAGKARSPQGSWSRRRSR